MFLGRWGVVVLERRWFLEAVYKWSTPSNSLHHITSLEHPLSTRRTDRETLQYLRLLPLAYSDFKRWPSFEHSVQSRVNALGLNQHGDTRNSITLYSSNWQIELDVGTKFEILSDIKRLNK